MGRPKIAPLDPADWALEIRPIAQKLGGHYLGLVNLHKTLANHPDLLRPTLAFASRILSSSLPPRGREILILRTAWCRQIPYEWAHHVIVGRSAGLSDTEIVALRNESAGAPFSGAEQALIQAADELVASSALSPATWEALASVFHETQLIDIIMTVGTYTMLGMLLKGIEVPLDPELAIVTAAMGIGEGEPLSRAKSLPML